MLNIIQYLTYLSIKNKFLFIYLKLMEILKNTN